MSIYLPIVEQVVALLPLLAIGGGVGFVSGVLGLGGGFLFGPALIAYGIPAFYAVGSQVLVVFGTSLATTLRYHLDNLIAHSLTLDLTLGSLIGIGLGLMLFDAAHVGGWLDRILLITYFTLLLGVSAVMGRSAWRRWRNPQAKPTLAIAMRYPGKLLVRDYDGLGLRYSRLWPFSCALSVGLLAGLMGIGGSFILIPILLIVLGVPASLVAGTAILQISLTSFIGAISQALLYQNVDLILAAILLATSVIGAQFGASFAGRLTLVQSRACFAFITLTTALLLLLRLVGTPKTLLSFNVCGVGC